ncbi:hypothetical protein J6590_007857 [Homalodisca vitripennis]|nr:hypothetical protein J6590_007857 [Homalodisca vitripennis]
MLQFVSPQVRRLIQCRGTVQSTAERIPAASGYNPSAKFPGERVIRHQIPIAPVPLNSIKEQDNQRLRGYLQPLAINPSATFPRERVIRHQIRIAPVPLNSIQEQDNQGLRGYLQPLAIIRVQHSRENGLYGTKFPSHRCRLPAAAGYKSECIIPGRTGYTAPNSHRTGASEQYRGTDNKRLSDNCRTGYTAPNSHRTGASEQYKGTGQSAAERITAGSGYKSECIIPGRTGYTAPNSHRTEDTCSLWLLSECNIPGRTGYTAPNTHRVGASEQYKGTGQSAAERITAGSGYKSDCNISGRTGYTAPNSHRTGASEQYRRTGQSAAENIPAAAGYKSECNIPGRTGYTAPNSHRTCASEQCTYCLNKVIY